MNIALGAEPPCSSSNSYRAAHGNRRRARPSTEQRCQSVRIRMVRMLTRHVCTSRPGTSPATTVPTPCNKVTALAASLPWGCGLGTSSSVGLVSISRWEGAGWGHGDHEPRSLCTPRYHRAPCSPCSPAPGGLPATSPNPAML